LKNQSLLEKQKTEKTRNLKQKTTLTKVTASPAKNKDEIESKQKTTEAPLERKKTSKLSCMSHLEILSMSENSSLSRARSKKED